MVAVMPPAVRAALSRERLLSHRAPLIPWLLEEAEAAGIQSPRRGAAVEGIPVSFYRRHSVPRWLQPVVAEELPRTTRVGRVAEAMAEVRYPGSGGRLLLAGGAEITAVLPMRALEEPIRHLTARVVVPMRPTGPGEPEAEDKDIWDYPEEAEAAWEAAAEEVTRPIQEPAGEVELPPVVMCRDI